MHLLLVQRKKFSEREIMFLVKESKILRFSYSEAVKVSFFFLLTKKNSEQKFFVESFFILLKKKYLEQ